MHNEPVDDIKHIVEDVRSLLASGDAAPVENLQYLVDRYSETVDGVNRRLADCAELLQRGYRCEALHWAESYPPLADQVEILLRLPHDRWAAYVAEILPQESARVPAVRVKVFERLRQASVVNDALSELLAAHRLHAMARSPLRTRIDALRRIVAIDTKNPLWTSDLAQLEAELHAQLRVETEEAIRRRDERALADLERELRDSPWREAPPQDLVEAVQQVRWSVCRRPRPNERDAFDDNGAIPGGDADAMPMDRRDGDGLNRRPLQPGSESQRAGVADPTATPQIAQEVRAPFGTYLDDLIEFAVYHPAHVSPGKWYHLIAIAYTDRVPDSRKSSQPTPAGRVRQEVERLLGPQIQRYKRTGQECPWQLYGDEALTFVPDIAEAEFNPSRLSVRWAETMHQVTFRVRFSAEAGGKVASGRVAILSDDRPVGEIAFNVRVKPVDASTNARMVERARARLADHQKAAKRMRGKTANDAGGPSNSSVEGAAPCSSKSKHFVAQTAANQGQLWYFTHDGLEQGPVSWSELQQQVRAGEVESNEFVWTEGMNDWQPVEAIPELME